MGWLQDCIESDKKIADNFKEIAGDREIHETVIKAIIRQRELAEQNNENEILTKT